MRATLPTSALLSSLLVAGPAAADKPTVMNAREETRSAASGLSGAVQGLAGAQAGPFWIGYSVRVVRGQESCCWSSTESMDGPGCPGCRLEGGGAFRAPATGTGTVRLEDGREMTVLLRVEGGRVMKVRTFSIGCALDAGGLPFHWLTDVRTADSLAYLSSLVDTSIEGGKLGKGLTDPALAAIALHDDPGADTRLDKLIAASQPEQVRKKAAFWMGNARGRRGFETLRRLVRDDADARFREHAIFALTQSEEPEAIGTIIDVGKHDASPRVRGQALFWLGQKAGQKASAAITDAIRDDPDHEVKK